MRIGKSAASAGETDDGSGPLRSPSRSYAYRTLRSAWRGGTDYAAERAGILQLYAVKLAAARLCARPSELIAILAAIRAERRAALMALRFRKARGRSGDSRRYRSGRATILSRKHAMKWPRIPQKLRYFRPVI